MGCFVQTGFEMCFAPKRCARFQHLNVQKRSGAEEFCTFGLRRVLRATTAYNCSTSQRLGEIVEIHHLATS